MFHTYNSSRSIKISSTCVALAAALLQVSSSQAQVNLSQGTSAVSINPGGGPGVVGMNGWSIGGQNQLSQQWFWYRIDNIAGLNVNQTIDTISLATVTPYDGTRGVRLLYANSAISIQVDYHLTGVSSLESTISESITVNNLTATPLAFHFFQYSDFNLAGTSGGDSGAISQNLITGLYNVADQVEGAIAFEETVATPGANRASVHMPPSIITALLGTSGDLDNLTGFTGVGNVAYGFEWNGAGGDAMLDPGEQLLIGKNKYLNLAFVPEPSSFALISLGLVGLLARRRAAK
jgi:hypothetical protein